MAVGLHEAIERDRAAAIPLPELVKDYRRYAAGDHDSTVASVEQRNYAGGLLRHPTVDNACDLVLATAASRLEFTGYAVDASPVQEFLDEFTVKNGLTDLQYDVHYRTLRDGDHYLGLAWTPARQTLPAAPSSEVPLNLPDAAVVPLGSAAPPEAGGRVTVRHEPAWDGETGTWVAYDYQGTVVYGVKDFVQLTGDPPHEVKRRIVYFPDHLERYVADGQGWRAFTLPGEDESARGIVPWTKRDGRPLGVPLVHFSYGRFGRAPYGASDLAGILGLQDHLNAALLDLAASAQLAAFPMLRVRGIDPKDGKLTVGPGRVLGSTNPDSDVGYMLPGDLSQLESYHQRILGVIARDTATPEHLIGAGAWPSGIAIQRADTPQIAKVRRLATTVGPAWATLGHRATEIENAYGVGGLDEDALVTALFAPPEQLDPEAKAAAAKANAESVATLATIDDPVLMARTGIVTLAEAEQIVAGRDARTAAAPVVAEF